MKIIMTLLSDAVFGSGEGDSAEVDIRTQRDAEGFPYLKGSTLKGIFREMLEQYLEWTADPSAEAAEIQQRIKTETARLLGTAGEDADSSDKLVFGDLQVPEDVKALVLSETRGDPDLTARSMISRRTFTAIGAEGTVKKGSLRVAECIHSGLIFAGEVRCAGKDEAMAAEVFSMIRWIGTMRNRGFGEVHILPCPETPEEG